MILCPRKGQNYDNNRINSSSDMSHNLILKVFDKALVLEYPTMAENWEHMAIYIFYCKKVNSED